jgi:hypothetical protein
MTSINFLHAEDLLNLIEGDTASIINGITADEIAEFRHSVRYAGIGAIVESGDQRFSCVAELVDGTKIYSPTA